MKARDDEVTRDSIWRTKDGQLVAVKDMKDSHLFNLIRCFRGMSPLGTRVVTKTEARRHDWLNALANEAYARGLQLDDLTETEPVHE